VLLFLKQYPQVLVEGAIEKALKLGLSDAQSLELLIEHWQRAEEEFEPLKPGELPELDNYQVAPPDLESYGTLLKGGC